MLNVDRQNDPGIVWMPLVVKSIMANTPDDIRVNIDHALSQDYIPFNKLILTKSGAVAIVGSGPSLKKNWRELLTFKGDIIACNAALKFLLEKGVVPTYMLCFDADPLTEPFFVPHKDVTYLLASRCPPIAFELLKDCKIVIWHAAGDEHLEQLLIDRGKGGGTQTMEPMVIGGTAAVSRAMCVAAPMGYREIHFYGADSSFDSGDTHISESTTKERRMAIRCNGRVFETAPWMTCQVEDFKKLIPKLQGYGLKFFIHGDGLLQTVAGELGCITDHESELHQKVRLFKRDWTHKARILWQHL